MSETLLQTFGVISALIGIGTIIPYYVDIVRGNTKPQKVAFLIFAILSTISFFGQLVEGATSSLLLPAVFMIHLWIVFILSLKYGVGGRSKSNIYSFIFSIMILVIWFFTRSAELAIILTVIVNTVGKYLIAEKVYNEPYSDLLLIWWASVFASLFAMISVGELDYILLLPHAQNALTVGIIAAIIVYRRKVIPLPSK